MRFYFPASEKLDALRKAAQNNFKVPYVTRKRSKPCAWLVKDSGVYLMVPADTQPERNVTYAKDHGPRTHLSGDDFAIFVPCSDLGKEGEGLVIDVAD